MNCCKKFKEHGEALGEGINYCPWCGHSLVFTSIKQGLVEALEMTIDSNLEDLLDECKDLTKDRTGNYDLGEGSKVVYEMSWRPEDGAIPVIQNARLEPSPTFQKILDSLYLSPDDFMGACIEDLSTALLGDPAYNQYADLIETFWSKVENWGHVRHGNGQYFWKQWEAY